MAAHETDRTGRVSVLSARELWFGPDDPVRSASAVVRLRDGWLIAQDDAVHAAWWREPVGEIGRVRLLDARDGLERFSEAAGTKRLKPDLEAACEVPLDGGIGALLLGSGSLPNRTTGVVVDVADGQPRVRARDLMPLYRDVAAALALSPDQLNLEGVCVVDDRLRWFQRGHGRSGVPSASVDLDLTAVVQAVTGELAAGAVPVGDVRAYDLGSLAGWPLAITDAVRLPDGQVCVSATAEDSPDPVADGPIGGSVLALLVDDGVPEVLTLPSEVAGHKIEGLAVASHDDAAVVLLAVVDADDPQVASSGLHLRLELGDHPPRRSVTSAGTSTA